MGHAFLQRHKAAASLPCAAAACAGKGVSRQCGNGAGSIRFSAEYDLGKPRTLVKTMQITVEQERGTLTRMPGDGAINNRARSCSFGAYGKRKCLEPGGAFGGWEFVVSSAGSQPLCSQAHSALSQQGVKLWVP